MALKRTLGITIHTGWGACVVVGGSLEHPEIVVNTVIDALGSDERFCYHSAAEMRYEAARNWIEHMREKALIAVRGELAPLAAQNVSACAIVAKEGEPGDLARVLTSHPLIHAAEGCFYRDVFRAACPVPVSIIPPSALDVSRVGKLAAPPWGRDQKLAALAAWSLIDRRTP